MREKTTWLGSLFALAFLITGSAAFASQADDEALAKKVEDTRNRLAAAEGSADEGAVDRALSGGPLGPNANVTTKAGKLTIGGLVQVWYSSIQNDTQGVFANPTVSDDRDSNEAQDNDSFSLQTVYLTFDMQIHENIRSFVRIDPSAEWGNRVSPTTNQGLVKRDLGANAFFAEEVGAEAAGGNNIAATQTGAGNANTLLTDAYINFHGLIPHHEFTIGQFVPKFGWEGPEDESNLNFTEYSFIGMLNGDRDLGVEVHGWWWGEEKEDARFHYWFGGLNGAGNFFGSAGSSRNRWDDNDAKDFYVTVMVQPLVDELWGTIELGYSLRFGTHGESGDKTVDGSDPVSGLNRLETDAIKHAAWASYHPGGPVSGFWLRGEYTFVKDRHAPATVVDLLGGASRTSAGAFGTATYQGAPNPFNADAWYAAIGYKLSDSIWADGMDGDVLKFVKPLEFVFRWQQWGNIQIADLNNPDSHTDVFKTDVFTAGFNYYIKGNNAKIQVNYNWVNEPDDNAGEASVRGIREVTNDSLVVNFQVAF